MKVNYDVLFHLSLNSREPLIKIGKKINRSQQYVNYNIVKLEKGGCILGYSTLFDYARFGYLVFYVHMRIIYSNELQYNSMIKDLVRNPDILAVSELGGASDLLLEFAAPNPSAFNKVFKEMITKYSSQLQSYTVLIEILKHIYPKTYMVRKLKQDWLKNQRDVLLGADRQPLDFNKSLDLVCYELHKNPRTPVVSISRKLELSPKTVMSKIKELEAAKIIRGYRPVLDLEKLGIVHNKLFLQLNYQNIEEEQELIRYFKEYEYVTQVTKTIGKWDLILDIETFNDERFRKVFLTIRAKLKPILREIEKSKVDKIFKRLYLPDSYFSKYLPEGYEPDINVLSFSP